MKKKEIELSSAITVLANIGVIVGIVFLALELRQTNDAVRSAVIQDISRWSYDSAIVVVENAELREAQLAACQGQHTEVQRRQLNAFYSALLKIQMNRFYQRSLGVIDEGLAMGLGGRGPAYRRPIFAEIWNNQRNQYDPEFQEFIDAELIPLAQDEC